MIRAKTIAAGGAVLALGTTIAEAKNIGFPVDWVTAPACTGLNATAKDLCRPINLSDYKLAWSDEFTGAPSIAWGSGTSTWAAGYHANLGPGDVQAQPTDAKVYSVSSGILTLATYRTDKGLVEANLQSWTPNGKHEAPLQNFYAEVRTRGPQGASHSGVWFLSQEQGHGHTEIDLVEQYGPSDQYDHATSHEWPNSSGLPAHAYNSTTMARPEGKAIAWHVYGMRATSTSFTVYRDGKPMKQIARQPAQQVPLYLLLSLFSQTANSPADMMQVDYVRVYLPKD